MYLSAQIEMGIVYIPVIAIKQQGQGSAGGYPHRILRRLFRQDGNTGMRIKIMDEHDAINILDL